MRSLIACVALVALAACNSQESTEAEATEAPAAPAAAVEPIEPSLSPPHESTFAAAYAEACPGAEKVSTSLCKSAGFGKEDFICEYGLGDDEYRRNKATLEPRDGAWVLAEPEKICAADAA